MFTRFIEEDSTDKSFEEYVEEDKKPKKPKGGCKSEEEEEMVLEAIKELSAKIDAIEARLIKWDEEDEKLQKDLEEIATAMSEKERKEEEDAINKQIEEDEDYIKSTLNGMNELMAKFSVQSK
jgi:septal ring factor EnvC (AmiA/AmiB activator)